jgi:hypothetical protein
MIRRQDDDEDDSILRDGETRRVPLLMRDAMRAEIAEDAAKIAEAVRLTEARMRDEAAVQARALADAENAHAWRGGAREGDACIFDGRPGVLVKEGDQLVARPLTAASAESRDTVMGAAYEQYDREVSERWRSGR